MEVAMRRSEDFSNQLTHSFKNLTGLKPKLTYAMRRNPHEDISEDEVDSRYPNLPQDPQGYKKAEEQGDLQWSLPT
jgi:hypothetical protein